MPSEDNTPSVSATAKPALAKHCPPSATPTGTKPKPCWKNGDRARTQTSRSMPPWPENAPSFSRPEYSPLRNNSNQISQTSPPGSPSALTSISMPSANSLVHRECDSKTLTCSSSTNPNVSVPQRWNIFATNTTAQTWGWSCSACPGSKNNLVATPSFTAESASPTNTGPWPKWNSASSSNAGGTNSDTPSTPTTSPMPKH